MSNILITGATGQLGSTFKEIANDYTQYTFYFANSKELNITSCSKIYNYCLKNNISVIINCAAYTSVDLAETEVEQCNLTNNIAVKELSFLAKELKIQLIHISTDYVFNGQNHTFFTEKDIPNPLNMYGKTKWLGEQAMLKINPSNSIIIRTSWVYSKFGTNFIKTMLKLAAKNAQLNIISDQIGSPTNTFDLATTILKILPKINNSNTQVYHYSNEGICSWYDFAFEIFSITNTKCKIVPIKTIEYPTPAKRPLFSILDKSKIKNEFEIQIPHWKESLVKHLKKV